MCGVYTVHLNTLKRKIAFFDTVTKQNPTQIFLPPLNDKYACSNNKYQINNVLLKKLNKRYDIHKKRKEKNEVNNMGLAIK